jgi:hypothetical protein
MPSPKPEAAGSARAVASYGKLPLSFEPNLGQTDKQVQWVARGPRYTLYLSGKDAVLQLNRVSAGADRDAPRQLSSSAVRMKLVGAHGSPAQSGEEPLPGKANYLTGNDSSQWQRNVPTFGKVRLRGVYPGIDLVYYGRQGRLEYDFVVAPGADPAAIELAFDGAQAKVAGNGDLVLPVAGDPGVRFDKPVVYQMKDGVRQPVDGGFKMAANRRVGFRLGAYDRSRELVIDPTLVFLGALATGNQQTVANGMAVDADGEMIITGETNDLAFPVTTGALQTVCDVYSSFARQTLNRCGGSSGGSGFVTKISADGTSLVYSTYLHGTDGWESGGAVATDAKGDAYVEGETSSNDFPITANAYQSDCAPTYEGSNIFTTCDGYYSGGGTEYTIASGNLFIVELDPTGSKLLYGTFVGGSATVYPAGIALDSSGNIYFASYVSTVWPASDLITSPYNTPIQYPTTATAFQQYGSVNGAAALSVLQIGATSSTMLYSTLYGTDDTKDGYVGYNSPLIMAIGPNGMAYMGGVTTSASLPTKNAIKPNCATAGQANYNLCYTNTAWLAAFNTTLSGDDSLAYATYIGGTELPEGSVTENEVAGLLADSANNLYVTGNTSNIDFPTTAGTYQTSCMHNNNANTCNTAFLMKLTDAGALTWSTFFGNTTGYSATTGNMIQRDSRGWVYLYGYNNGYGWDLPLVNPLEEENGSSFVFVAAFNSTATHLLFSTPLFESCCSAYGTNAVSHVGFYIDHQNNMYVAAYGNDGGALVTTPGTYATTATSGFNRTWFAKLTPVQTIPTITWAKPAAVLYGTPLGDTQLDATSSVAGTFEYTPPATTVLGVGNQTLSVAFTPTDTTLYSSAEASVMLTVKKATPAITWPTPAAIPYGTLVSATQEDATANVPGTFAYSQPIGWKPKAGSHTISVTATPTDTNDYTTATAVVTLVVNQAKPVIAWTKPASIGYGTALGAAQLDATSTVAGTFAYTPAAGTVLAIGSHTLSVTLTPTDTADYVAASATTTVTVSKATPVITWATPASIVYGTLVSATQENATASVAGTFTYSQPIGWKPTAGTHSLAAYFTPADTVDYNKVTTTVTLTVTQATPKITWATPAAIPYGTALAVKQLDATANVPGSFTYTPAAGVVLKAGSQSLSVTFTPSDTADYTTATGKVTLTVNPAKPLITWPTPAPITYGTAVSATQEDATANVPGAFVYSQPIGWKPIAGTHMLSVKFTPTDTTDYLTATGSVTLTVNP